MDKKTCDDCDGNCCKYVIVEIAKPKDSNDIDEIKWYLSHKNISVFIDEDKTWNVEFKTDCKYLDSKNRCKIYNKRHNVCREHSHDECTFHNEWQPIKVFNELEEFEEYIKENNLQ